MRETKRCEGKTKERAQGESGSHENLTMQSTQGLVSDDDPEQGTSR